MVSELRQNDGISGLHFDGYARMTEFKNGCGTNVCRVSAIGTVIAMYDTDASHRGSHD